MRRRIGLVALAGVALGAGAAPPASARLAPTISHHAITARLAPESGHVLVQDVFRLDDERPVPPAEPLSFLLHEGLAIVEITAGRDTLSFSEREGFDPRRFWESPDWASLSAYDHVRQIDVAAPPRGFGPGAEVRLVATGTIVDSLSSPQRDYGRSFETTTGLVEARGAFLSGETAWMPTVPGDRFTFELEADVPVEWDAVTQGRLLSRESAGDRRTVRFSCKEQMTEAYLVAGPYVLRRERHGRVDVMTYTYAVDDDLTGRYIDATRRYLDRFGAEIGPYPYAKFALVENFWESGYGMPSFTLLGSTVIRLPFIVDTSYGHEILHCWWGNGVFVDARGGNWCEGLTSYMADYAFKEDESKDAAREYRRNQLVGYRNYVNEGRDLPLRAFRERHSGATQAIGYGKSMMILHMLRTRVGDARFYGALRRFYAEFRQREASWDDLLDAFELASGEKLDWFAEQWIHKAGAPTLALADASAEPIGGGYRLRGAIVQNEPPFRLEVPVEIETVSGRVVRERVPVEGVRSPFTRILDEAPVELRVDPGFDVFRRLHREEIPAVLSQTLGAERVAIVLPPSDDPLLAAYREVADRWATSEGVRILEAGEATGGVPAGHAAWILGESPLATRFSDVLEREKGGALGPLAGKTLVATIAHPDDPELTWSLLRLAGAGDAAALARKIPHYGRYSYLLFEGSTNVAKGTWPGGASPLVSRLGGDEGPEG